MTFIENIDSTYSSVRVAARVRPQNAKERLQMNQICTSVTSNEPQIFIGKDKAFTFDYVFNITSKQDDLFTSLCRPLIDGCLEGYNATILAYGQTGSGKTYTMGSGFDVSLENQEVGIIPRAVQYLFNRIDQIKLDAKIKNLPVPDFKIVAQFLELYNEELVDLLDMPDNKNMKSHIKIHENTGGSIYLTGVSTRLVISLEDTLKCLKDGTLCRSTASTNMNSQSSRSHAIFTLHIKQQRFISNSNEMELSTHSNSGSNINDEFETLTAKFHFVDLAGSERLKRTGATGDRAKEGISINCGLLALGNVISTLGDRSKRGQHVPYRNSKLTRLLQDSLGGNSQTIMIACVSPSDCDFLETLNTLNYANRARNIKNRVTVNQDKTSKQLSAMRIQIEQLQAELYDYKQGKRGSNTEEGYGDLYSENSMLQTENQSLRSRVKALASTIDTLKARNAQILAEKETCLWNFKKNTAPITENDLMDLESEEIIKVVEKYTKEVEDLRAKLAESEAMVTVLQRSTSVNSALDSSRQHHHVSMSGEFPDNDYLYNYESVTEDSYLPSPKKHKKRNRDMRMSTNKSNNMCGSLSTVGGALDTDGDTLPIDLTGAGNGGATDIDRDSLNGDGDQDEHTAEEEDSIFEEQDDEDNEQAGPVDDEDNDEESDTDNQDAENYLHRSLATLSSEIDVKRRLIDELQSKQRQLRKIRSHYEQQLELLQNRIKETENERDQVLANLGEVEMSNEERVRKVQQDYEKKLLSLKSELNQLQTAKREHTLMLKNQQRKDQELRQLQRELSDLKSLKVQMSKKLREEAKRTREIETTRNREIVQLRKEKRLKDNQIRNLEQDKQRRDNVLKRKQEELESLRRKNQNSNLRNISASINRPQTKSVSIIKKGSNSNLQQSQQSAQSSSRVHIRRNSVLAKVTKSKLDALEAALKKTVSRRHTITSYENDMNTRVKEREKLSRKLQRLDKKHSEFENDGKGIEKIQYDMKNIRAQIESIQDEITECQSNILELSEAKLDESISDIIAKCSLDEAQYLLEQVFQLAINKGLVVENLEVQEGHLRYELETKFQEREQALDMLRIALQHSTVPFDIDGLFVTGSSNDNLVNPMGGTSDEDDDDCDEAGCEEYFYGNGPGSSHNRTSDSTTTAAWTFNNNNGRSMTPADGFDTETNVCSIASSKNASTKPDSLIPTDGRRQVSKRKPATPEELLGVNKTSSTSTTVPTDLGGLVNLDYNNNSSFVLNSFRKNTITSSTLSAQTPTETSKGLIGGNISKQQQQSHQPLTNESVMTSSMTSKSVGGGGGSIKTPQIPPRSPNRKPLVWKHPGGSMTTSLIVQKPNNNTNSASEETTNVLETPPMSPMNFRRALSQRSQNDDNVFRRLTNTRPSPNPKKGSINSVSRKTSIPTNCPLLCNFIAEGHHKAVLDVDVSGNIMITGSKDRTAKIWDLVRMTETACLSEHQNSVTKVRYAPHQHLAFTVCTYYIKMWDLRQGNCVRTLWSSGLSQEGGPDIAGPGGSSSSVSSLSTSRQTACPPPGENFIMDIALAQNHQMMFLATANSVKLWDMRHRYCAVGKLHGNHQAPVMVLAAADLDAGSNRLATTLVTGSKDHYIKVFEVDSGSVGLITPSQELQPPHYDGVEALTLYRPSILENSYQDYQNILFSGSRDACIKKWDLKTGQCVNSLSQAHRDWVQALCIARHNPTTDVSQPTNDLLISGCRSGVIKVWSADNCIYLGDVQAHDSGITSLRFSSQTSSIFSASSDGKVKIWKPSSNLAVENL